MSNWSNLPIEILDLIFNNLDEVKESERNLDECALTCRKWRMPAQKHFFSTLIFDDIDDVLDFNHLVLDEKSKHIGELVKRVKYNTKIFDDDSEEEQETGLHTMFSLFPRLEELNASSSISFYRMFYKLFNNGSLPNLKILPTPKNKEEDDIYLQCLPIIRDRLTTIDLVHDTLKGRNTLDKLKSDLHQFNNLKNIHVFVVFETFQIGLNYFDSIYKDFSHELYLTIAFLESIQLPPNHTSFQTYVNVKELTLKCYASVWIDNDDFLLFIQNHFPNLNRILVYNMGVSDPFRPGATSSPTVEGVLKFLKYLLTIQNYSFERIVTNGNAANIIDNLFKLPESKILDHCLNGLHIKYKRPLMPMLYNMFRRTRMHDVDEDSSTEALDVTYDSQNKRFETKVTLYTQTGESNSLYKVIKSAGSHYVQLRLDNIPSCGDTPLLDLVAQHCRNLTTLSIMNDTHLESSTPSTLSANHPLLSLELTQFPLSPEFFSMIELYFPSLESIVFDKIRNPGKFMEINLPNTSLDYLKFVFNTDNRAFIRGQYNKVIVKIIAGNEEDPSYYCLAVESYEEKDYLEEEPTAKSELSHVSNLTEQDYSNGVEDEMCIVYLLRCKSVDYVNLTSQEI